MFNGESNAELWGERGAPTGDARPRPGGEKERDFETARDRSVPVSVREILFVKLLGRLGDVPISLPAVQALARSYPEARLTVLTFTPGGELLKRDPAHSHRAREAIEELLSRGNWDLVVSDTSYNGIGDVIRACEAPRVATNLWQSPPPPSAWASISSASCCPSARSSREPSPRPGFTSLPRNAPSPLTGSKALATCSSSSRTWP